MPRKPILEQKRFLLRKKAEAREMERAFREHGEIHPAAQRAVIPALEKALKSGWYMPKLVGGKGKKAMHKRIQRVIYVREGPQIVLYETIGEQIAQNTMPAHGGKTLAIFRKTKGGAWVNTTAHPHF